MEVEEYDIVKLYDKLDFKDVYVSILKITGDICLVNVLKQPSYNLVHRKYSDAIFKQYCDPDDEVWNTLLNFDKDEFTFEVNKNMCQQLSKEELVEVLKYLNHVDFGDSNLEKMIINIALEKLK